jgi:hypothetical protein
MGASRNPTYTRLKGIGRLFPVLAEVLEQPRTAARLETLEIIMDVEQVSDLLSSWDDARKGRILSMQDAFGDL